MFERELNHALKTFLEGGFGIARMCAVRHDLKSGPGLGPSSLRSTEKEVSNQLRNEVKKDLLLSGMKETSIFTSVTHTLVKDCSWIIVIGSDQRIGVDLEASSRVLHSQILFRITTPEERACFNWNALKYWVIKEAAFKSNPNNQETVLPQYQVEKWNSQDQTGDITLPAGGGGRKEWRCRFKFLELDAWYIALAHCKHNRQSQG